MSAPEPALLTSGPLGRMEGLAKRLAREGIEARVLAPPGAQGNA